MHAMHLSYMPTATDKIIESNEINTEFDFHVHLQSIFVIENNGWLPLSAYLRHGHDQESRKAQLLFIQEGTKYKLYNH